MDQWEGWPLLIQIWVIVLLVVVCGGLAYFAVDVAFNAVADVMTTTYPTYFTGTGWTFTTSIMAWLPWFAIILACVLFTIVWSQKRGQGLVY